MTDAHFVGPWNHTVEVGQIDKAEVVAGIEAQSQLARCHGGIDEWLDGLLTVGEVIGGIRLRIQLHAVGSAVVCALHHFLGSVHEDARADAGFLEPADYSGEESLVADGVPSVVARQLRVAVGHECHLCWLHLKHQVYVFLDGVALDVEFGGYQRLDVSHVLVSDVALVRSRMYG